MRGEHRASAATRRQRTHSRVAYGANSGLSKSTCRPSQKTRAAASVLLTSMLPQEKPLPIGWSM